MTYAAIAAGYNKTISVGPVLTPTFLLIDYFYAATSSNGAGWTTTSKSYWNGPSVTYGSGKFVGVGQIGYSFYRSTNGIGWDYGTIPYSTGTNWNYIMYGNGTFVINAHSYSAYYGTTTTLYSNDTITWGTASVPYNSYGPIAFGSGKFIMIYDYFDRPANMQYLYSSDATSWTVATRTTGGNCALYDITYGNGKFVAVGNDGGLNGRSQMSTDGINWTQGTMVPYSYPSVVFGNGIFLAYTKYSGSLSAVSTDGVNWTTVETVPAGVNKILFGNGVFVAYAQASGFTHTSTDGQSWTYTGTVLPYAIGTFGFVG